MSRPTGFHVRHDFQPTLTYELLTLLRIAPSGQPERAIQEGAAARGYRLRHRKDYGKLFSSLAELDLLDKDGALLMLTEQGQVVARITVFQRDLLPEFIHFLYYTAWDDDQNKRFSWSYREVCNALWDTAPCVINRDRLVNLVTQSAAEIFQTNEVSFSISSVAGILNWLVELNPLCISDQGEIQYFKRRDCCSVELFALALNHTYRQRKPSDGSYIQITEDLRAAVCKICLIVPEAFHEMLAQAETSFSCIHVRRERGDRLAIEDFSWSTLEN